MFGARALERVQGAGVYSLLRVCARVLMCMEVL
jgi:hypothetical protein